MADEPKWQPADTPPWLQQGTKPAEPNWQPAEDPPWAKKKEERGGLSEAIRPITTYWPTYKEVVKEATETMGRGVEELTKPTGGDLWESAKAAAKGVAGIGGGAIQLGISPATAGIRTTLSRPVEEITGIPKEYTEFGAELAIPGIGLTRVPRIPMVTRTPAKGPEAEAGRLLEHQIRKEGGDPEAVRRAVEQPEEIVPGSKPTTFQASGDLGAGQVERGATTRHPAAFQERFGEQNAARLEAIEKLQPAGSPEEVATHLRNKLREETTQADEGVRLAQQRAWEASQQIGGTYDPTTYGNIMRRGLQDAEEATRAYERSLWQRIDPDGTLRANPQGVQELERRIYGVMPEGGAAEASLSAAERQIGTVIQNFPPQGIPFTELRTLRSMVSAELRKELSTNGSTPAYARLSQLRAGIEDAIAGSVPPDVYERVRAATQATAQRAQTFRAEGVKQATRREGVQGPYKIGEASVPDQFIKPGAKGYDTASNYLRAVGEPGLEDFSDAVAARARREVIGTNGEINPRKLEGFLRRHQDVLRAIDERDGGAFSQRLRNLGTVQETLDTAIARQTVVAKQQSKDAFANIIGATDEGDVNRMIAGIFGRVDAEGRMRELVSRLGGNDAALQGARRAVVEHLRTRLLSNMEAAATGKPIIRAEQFQNFVKHNKRALQQIMAPEQVQSMLDIARDIQQRSNRTVQTGIRGRSTTAQDIEALKRQEESAVKAGAKQAGKIIGKGLIDQLMAFIPGGPFAVRTGEAVLSAQMAKWKAKGINTIQEMVDEAMLNPESAREILSKTHTTTIRKGIRSPYQAGGGVPAIGGTGGRSPGATTPAGARQARQGAGQALADGGEAREQQSGTVGYREKMAALLKGTPTAGSFEKLQSRKPLQALSREDVRRTLQQFGISGEAAGGFGERQLGEVDSRATGGGIDPDYPTGERRTNVFPEDPSEEPAPDTFEDRFGNWRSEKMGHQRVTVPNPVYRNLRDAEDRAIGNRPLVPGEVVPNPMWFGRARAFQTGGILKALERSLKAARGQAPIKGLPQKPLDVGGEKFVPGPSADVREAAEQYMREKGLPYTPVQNYVPVDEPRARAIARAYDLMKHNPDDPAVREAYEALANETRDQYEVIRRGGAKFEPIPAGKPDPYGATPRLAAKDFLENRHMYYFPTEQGFGSEASGIVSKEGQKMLEPSGVKIAGKEVPFNDLFRIVHDVFGHHKEGVGFRAAGEENAWRSHGRMYSPKALPAMTAETRGQNSWVNYGPYAAQNKGASAADTVYAPQKLGILPQWVIRSGRMTPLGVAGAAAALEEGDRDAGYADGGGVDDDSRPPMPDAVMDAWGDPWERAAGRTARAVRPQSVTRTGREEGPATQLIEDVMLPKSPLDLGLMVLGGPFRWPIKAAGLAAGALMEPSEAEAGVASKLGRKAVPAAGRTVTRSHNMPPEPVEAPFPQYAEDYPPVGPPTPKPKTKPKFEGETYPSKTLTPEGEAFMKARTKIMRDMEKKGFTPYFDPTQRTHVDPANYPPPNVDTSTLQPKKAETVQNYLDVIDMPATKELLRDAYARGKELGDANDWYAMAQLEKAYIQELGMKAGRQAFLDEFAVPMAATTSGNDPRANLLMAHYFEYLRKKGEPIPEGHQFPATVGGRRPEMNIRDYEAMRRRGGYGGLGAGQPKMHDFSRSFVGDLSHGVVDEQMAEGMLAHHAKRKGATKEEKAFPGRARKGAYGLLQRPLHEEAAAAGVEPGRYQDIAWAGFKNEPGKPMIQIVNEAIERTHRLTGMSRDEIVRRGIIRKEIPIYGLGAAGAPSLLQGPSGEDGSSSPTPGQSTL